MDWSRVVVSVRDWWIGHTLTLNWLIGNGFTLDWLICDGLVDWMCVGRATLYIGDGVARVVFDWDEIVLRRD